MLRILHNHGTDPEKNNPLVANSNQVMEELSKATSPGAWMKTAKVWRGHLVRSIDDPYNYVKDQMAKGNDNVSYVAGLMKDVHRQIGPEEEGVISWSTASQGLTGEIHD
ncbi:hypothetical protein JX266_006430 [Neoarthrinium moseri]|nr:hypothetical protein JX266_006430 [Neoarthrinium moseri]